VPHRIAIDIDSTLHPYWDQLREVVLRRHGIDLPYEEQHTWDIDALPEAGLRAAVRETHTEAYVSAAEPYPGAVDVIRGWHGDGHWIHVTSHRAAVAGRYTRAWLERIGLPFDDLHCSFDKVSRCVELGIGVLIDDSPDTLARAAREGIVPATLRHPWNAEACDREGWACAPDWPGLQRVLAPVLAR
jgi:hypothetical protein